TEPTELGTTNRMYTCRTGEPSTSRLIQFPYAFARSYDVPDTKVSAFAESVAEVEAELAPAPATATICRTRTRNETAATFVDLARGVTIQGYPGGRSGRNHQK